MADWLARALMLLLVALVAVDAVIAERPPSPLPSTALPGEFSAERALAFAHGLLPEPIPHPTGSPENDRVRERLVSAFNDLGYEAAVETASSCSPRGRCATVKNVVATLKGARPDAVLVSAHYDSVPAGPGVGDDLAGAASVLEIARALKDDGPRDLSVVLLVDDGEELGLLGARSFVAEAPEAHAVRFAVNMDNRGDSGPAMMFETSSGNGELVGLLSHALRRPVATSLFYEVYRRMPNDTDFTVWKGAGMKGVNFAFIGSAERYHTQHDDFTHLDPASVQHEGESALAMVRALRDHPPSDQGSDVVYFAVFGCTLATCPIRLALPLGLAALLVYVLAVAIRLRQEQTTVRALLLENAAWVLGLGFAIAVSLALARMLGGPLFGPDVGRRATAFGLIGGAMGALALAGVRPLVRGGISHAPWLTYLVVGVVAAALVPGASYLFFFPGVVAVGVEMVLALYSPRQGSVLREVVSLLPMVGMAIVWCPVFSGVIAALGMAIPWLYAVIGALALFPALCLLRGRTSLLWVTGGSLCGAVAVLVLLRA
jgi:hypothetical protein